MNASDFVRVVDEELAEYAPELVGSRFVVVRAFGRPWVVKHKPGSRDEDQRDRLGHLLGRRFANTAEVRLLDQAEHAQVAALLPDASESDHLNTFLVRVVGSYSPDELTWRSLDDAAAAEVVYSTWIRRRDANANNRAYLNGVPVCFDFQTAFAGDSARDIGAFLGPTDVGQAGAWKLRLVDDPPTTEWARRGDVEEHYAASRQRFETAIGACVNHVVSADESMWREPLDSLHFRGISSDDVATFLAENQGTLAADVERVKARLLAST